jgi:hypothetical protein
MKILKSLTLVSYKTIISLSLAVGILFSISVTLVLIQNQTRLTTKADFRPLPQLKPKINKTEPFFCQTRRFY